MSLDNPNETDFLLFFDTILDEVYNFELGKTVERIDVEEGKSWRLQAPETAQSLSYL